MSQVPSHHSWKSYEQLADSVGPLCHALLRHTMESRVNYRPSLPTSLGARRHLLDRLTPAETSYPYRPANGRASKLASILPDLRDQAANGYGFQEATGPSESVSKLPLSTPAPRRASSGASDLPETIARAIRTGAVAAV